VASRELQFIRCKPIRYLSCVKSAWYGFILLSPNSHGSLITPELPRHSLAALLSLYCDFTADKRYQRADWRIRPLPKEMLFYARSDTHFLLYVWDRLCESLLDRGQGPGDLIRRTPQKLHPRSSFGKCMRPRLGKAPGGVLRWYNKRLLGMKNRGIFPVRARRNRAVREEAEARCKQHHAPGGRANSNSMRLDM